MKKEFRKEVYAVIERLLGRELTIDEHTEIKEIMMRAVEEQAGSIVEMRAIVDRQGQKISALKKGMHTITTKRGVPEDVVAFLKEKL
jgi:hypothetical protein